MTYELHHGDCLELLRLIPAESVDAIVTDPPYGLEFMGKEWDHGVPGVPFFAEMLRVLKPGGHLLSFGGTRTYHRMTCAIEDASFEIRDCLMWLYGSGFPKSMDVSKAIDKAAGAERTEVIGSKLGRPGMAKDGSNQSFDSSANTYGAGGVLSSDITAAATPEAEQWQGWGTALKPACEPIVLARKPLIGTVAKNVLAHGTGALNIDASRIGDGGQLQWSAPRDMGYHGGSDNANANANANAKGRWPANVLFDEEAAELLDEQSGRSTSRKGAPRASASPGDGYGMTHTGAEYSDTGGASRFFYVAKAAKSERNRGVIAKNDHPTVKPVALMEYLVRLITPARGLVLDPFAGSGTTGVAAVRLGFDFVGIDQDAHYLDIAEQRIRSAANALITSQVEAPPAE